MTAEKRDIEDLIERSSLGTPAAKAARESVPPGVGTAIALAARYLGERNGARDLAAKLEAQLAAVEALLTSEDAKAVLYGVTGTHPMTYGGVTKYEALECACGLITDLRAALNGTDA